MQLQKFLEFKEVDLDPVKSFHLKDDLNDKIWTDFQIDDSVREDLLKIGEDFYHSSELKADVVDIVLCGSLCNYNWSEKYSDYDLHIIINFKQINDDLTLVEKLCDLTKKLWNQQHNIKIKGYDVEIAIQNKNDLSIAINSGRMGGVYSLLKDKWIKKPERIEFEPDEKMISEKGKSIMLEVDDLIEDKDIEYDELRIRIKKVWDKIKKLRERSLEEEGEYGIGNLVFKLLRRNNYLGKIMDLKKNAYDKQFEAKSFSFFLHDKLQKSDLDNFFGFNREDVDDTLQDIYDELSDYIETSVNFQLGNGKSIGFHNPEDSENFNYIKKNVKKICCEIHIYMNENWCSTLWNKGIKSIDCPNLEIEGESIHTAIKKRFNASFYESMGYKVSYRTRNTSMTNRIDNHPEANVKYGPSILSIFIEKNINKIDEEYDEESILNFLYEVEKIDSQLPGDEGWSQYINYNLDEDNCKILIEMGAHGYSEGWSDNWMVDYSDPEYISVDKQASYSGPYGNGNNESSIKFDSFRELLDDIKNNF